MAADKYLIENFSHLPHTIPGATEQSAGVMTAAQVAQLSGSTFWFNVKSYGATGDGVTDDGPAIQRTINAYEEAGGKGTIYFPRPSASYKIVTPVVTNAGVTNPFLRVFGDGAVIKCASPGNDCMNFGAYNTVVEGLILQSDGSTVVQRGLVLTGNTNELKNCIESDVLASLSAFGVGGTSSFVHEISLSGGTCALGILWIFSIQALVEGITGQDGVVNQSPCWVYLDNSSPFDVYRILRNISCDESNGSWVKIKASGLLGSSRITAVDIDGLRGIKDDAFPCIYAEKVDRLTVANFTPEPAGQLFTVQLVDVTKSKFSYCDLLEIGPTAPASILEADAQCGVLEVYESNFSSIKSAAATTTVITNGVRSSIVPAATTAVAPGFLMKFDTANAGQYVKAEKIDNAADVVGALIAGPAAASTTFMMPAVSDFNQSLFPALFYISDDNNVIATIGLFALSTPAHGFGGLIPVDLTGLVTAAQVAQAFSTAINATTRAGFSVSSTVDGTGNITIFCTNTGADGDRSTTGATFPNNGQAPLLTPNSGALVGGNQGMQMGLIAGQQYQIQIDGVDVIHVGDRLTLSTVTDGQAAKFTTTGGAFLFTAAAAATATAGALVLATFLPGYITPPPP